MDFDRLIHLIENFQDKCIITRSVLQSITYNFTFFIDITIPDTFGWCLQIYVALYIYEIISYMNCNFLDR